MRSLDTFASVLQAARQCAPQGRPALIAIDGRCGSGKTTLAALLRTHLHCTVLHMDDFYLPLSDRPAGWEVRPAGHMDLTRLRTESLEPARTGQAIPYRAYSCRTGAYAPPQLLPSCPWIVVEGSYCLHPSLAGLYDLRVFLTCAPAIQLDRLRARENTQLDRFQSAWIPMEERYFAACGLPDAADLLLDTSGLPCPHPRTEKE